MHSWTTAGRPAQPRTGEFGWNRTLAALEVWDGATWASVGGGGASCVDAISVYDNAGGQPIVGALLLMDTTQGNTNPANLSLGSVVAGAVTILNDGDYLIRYGLAVNDPAGASNVCVQGVLMTTPSGLAAWGTVVGADSYAEMHRTSAGVGGVIQTTGEAIVTVSGGLGLDVMLLGNTILGTAPATFAQGSRLTIEKVC